MPCKARHAPPAADGHEVCAGAAWAKDQAVAALEDSGQQERAQQLKSATATLERGPASEPDGQQDEVRHSSNTRVSWRSRRVCGAPTSAALKIPPDETRTSL